ncbi:hypothetical protein GCM10022408_01310 [Hymenobacter fastidiosus]|uniref:Uncharacterized protein n=1 Tax=Hymenobacter fastidiosus TaxID=486264 RepID=A0ABP7R9V5_9BACT
MGGKFGNFTAGAGLSRGFSPLSRLCPRPGSIPVARLGFRAGHGPYHANWIFERVEPEQLAGLAFHTVQDVREVLDYLP